MNEKTKFKWDGETIIISKTVDDTKITPKVFVDGFENTKNQLSQFTQQKMEMEQQIKQIDSNIASINDFLEERKDFADECNKIMEKKLNDYIKTLTPELIKKAEEESKKIADKDPNSLTPEQLINQKYVIYQKMLATNPKVAQNISVKIITDKLYDKPIFENPFKVQ